MKMNCFNPNYKKKSPRRNPTPATDCSNLSRSPEQSSSNSGAKCSAAPPAAASSLSIQDSGDLRQVFEKFDANGDGRISTDELESMLRCLGFAGSREEVEAMMREADTDGDGFVNLDEFLHMNTQETDASKCMEDLRNAFTIFDRDKNGLISADELHQVLRSLGDSATLSACKDMIRGVDQNGDGQVNFEEFMMMMTKSPR
ncbi:polcalcin Cup a 4-like [Nymphaea colorata]|nr:polcalcin Cup a 4-like [Nymphaea colorata]